MTSDPQDVPSSPLSSKLTWIGLALLGILVAAGVSVAASRLSSQRIGLASEPISAGRDLAPPAAGGSAGGPSHHARHRNQSKPSASSSPAPPASPIPPPPSSPPTSSAPQPVAPSSGGDDSADSHSAGQGRGGDD